MRAPVSLRKPCFHDPDSQEPRGQLYFALFFPDWTALSEKYLATALVKYLHNGIVEYVVNFSCQTIYPHSKWKIVTHEISSYVSRTHWRDLVVTTTHIKVSVRSFCLLDRYACTWCDPARNTIGCYLYENVSDIFDWQQSSPDQATLIILLFLVPPTRFGANSLVLLDSKPHKATKVTRPLVLTTASLAC